MIETPSADKESNMKMVEEKKKFEHGNVTINYNSGFYDN